MQSRDKILSNEPCNVLRRQRHVSLVLILISYGRGDLKKKTGKEIALIPWRFLRNSRSCAHFELSPSLSAHCWALVFKKVFQNSSASNSTDSDADFWEFCQKQNVFTQNLQLSYRIPEMVWNTFLKNTEQFSQTFWNTELHK